MFTVHGLLVPRQDSIAERHSRAHGGEAAHITVAGKQRVKGGGGKGDINFPVTPAVTGLFRPVLLPNSKSAIMPL